MIANNHAGKKGGGIQISGYNGGNNVINNIIVNNTSDENGGGIFIGRMGPSILMNNIICNNKAPIAGGVGVGEGITLLFANNIVGGNEADLFSQFYFMGEDGEVIENAEFINNVIEGGTESLGSRWQVAPDDFIHIEKNLIDIDPMFTNPTTGAGIEFDGAAGDWTVQAGSFCIDAGTTFSNLPKKDIVGNDRVYNNGTVDIGAYEYQGANDKHLPVLEKTVDRYINVNDTFELMFAYSEFDADETNEVTITSDQANLTIIEKSGNASGSSYKLAPKEDWTGTANITVTVKDASGEAVSNTFTVVYTPIVELCGTIDSDTILNSTIVIIKCNVNINDNATVYIKPGTKVIFREKATIYVDYGRILAEGTETAPILFTSADPKKQGSGIRFNETDYTSLISKFKYCTFENQKAYGSSEPENIGGAMAIIDFSNVEIGYCSFLNNLAMYCGGALTITGESNVDIKNCYFEGNTALDGAGALQIDDYAISTIQNNTFKGNVSSNYGGALRITNYASATIVHNTFIENFTHKNGAGVAVDNYAKATITDNTVTQNISRNHGGGISIMEDASATIKNNTITGNTALNHGGGISVHGENVKGIITENTITNNMSNHWGGGIAVINEAFGLISKNTITNNTAIDGGGIAYNDDVYGSFSENLIENNTASHNGGGVAIKNANDDFIIGENNVIKNNRADSYSGGVQISGGSLATLKNNFITGNHASLSGGAIKVCGQNSSGTELNLYNNVIAKNIADDCAGAILVNPGATVTSVNNTIAENTATLNGGGLVVTEGVDGVSIKNTIVWGNFAANGSQVFTETTMYPSVRFSDIQGSWQNFGLNSEIIPSNHAYEGTYESNIDADPLFTGNADHPYFLSTQSPCLNAGDTTTATFTATDLFGTVRFLLDTIDIGAYEIVNNAPFFTNDLFVFDVNENSEASAVVGTALASDVNQDPLSYSIKSQSVTGALAIGAANGELTVADSAIFDYEKLEAITLTVKVTDNGPESYTEEVEVTVNIVDVNEAPAFLVERYNLVTGEKSVDNEQIGMPVIAFDPEQDVLTYSIGEQTKEGAMAIDAATAQLSIADASKLVADSTMTIKVVASDGELTDTATISVFVLKTVGIAGLTQNTFIVYPNPSNGIMNIKFNEATDATVQIVNIAGQVVYQNDIISDFATLNLKNLAKGYYTMRVNIKGQVLSSKIMIK